MKKVMVELGSKGRCAGGDNGGIFISDSVRRSGGMF